MNKKNQQTGEVYDQKILERNEYLECARLQYQMEGKLPINYCLYQRLAR